MAASETKTDKRKGPRGPRVPKPVFTVVTVTGPDGQELNINAQSGYQTRVRISKDNAELVAMLTSGNAANAAVVQAEQAAASRPNPGDAA